MICTVSAIDKYLILQRSILVCTCPVKANVLPIRMWKMVRGFPWQQSIFVFQYNTEQWQVKGDNSTHMALKTNHKLLHGSLFLAL